MMSRKSYEALLIGAGNRGAEVYGQWILAHPAHMKITAVAEPVDSRRQKVASQHQIPPDRQFNTWEEALGRGQLADVAIICTQDQHHTRPAVKAIEVGYDVLLEKPMAHNLADCVRLVQAAERHGRLLQIAHVLRYTEFFQHVYQIVQSGELGQIITVSHRENVSTWHMAHSYVRGNWRRVDQSSPMILAKSCHDLDILYWILGSAAMKLSSVGSLRHFTVENAPSGAPLRCLDGCPEAERCPYFAPALYIDLVPIYQGLSNSQSLLLRSIGKWNQQFPKLVKGVAALYSPLQELTAYGGWPRSVITDHPANISSLEEALKTGPYGRCVYHCDNDVVDHQVVLMELENGVSVSFTMHGHSFEEGRTIRIDGARAALLGKFGWSHSYIEVHRHRDGLVRRIDMPNNIERGGHGGGDRGLMGAFVATLDGAAQPILTDARASLESHLLAFAAEEARISRKTIDMYTFHNNAGV